jgi:magnesium chelatase family protein
MESITLKAVGFLNDRVYPIDVRCSVDVGHREFRVRGIGARPAKDLQIVVTEAIRARGYRVPVGINLEILQPPDIAAQTIPIRPGNGVDCAAALAVVMASGQAQWGNVGQWVILGGLGMDGRVQSVPGLYAAAVFAGSVWNEGLMVARHGVAEAVSANAAPVLGIDFFDDVVTLAAQGRTIQTAAPVDYATLSDQVYASGRRVEPDLADMKLSPDVQRALDIAVTGRHGVVLVGVPGTGRTMLARRIAGLLPTMTDAERRECACRFSIAGMLGSDPASLVIERPFRAPHYTVSAQGLVGNRDRFGEMDLAHNGVLFLDELPEFHQNDLQVLAAALSARRAISSPLVVVSMMPCPCGYMGSTRRPCACSAEQVKRYHGRVKWFLDKICDVRIDVTDMGAAPKGELTTVVQQRVGRAMQTLAYGLTGTVEVPVALPLTEAQRTRARVVARTIAALGGRSTIAVEDYQEAARRVVWPCE